MTEGHGAALVQAGYGTLGSIAGISGGQIFRTEVKLDGDIDHAFDFGPCPGAYLRWRGSQLYVGYSVRLGGGEIYDYQQVVTDADDFGLFDQTVAFTKTLSDTVATANVSTRASQQSSFTFDSDGLLTGGQSRADISISGTITPGGRQVRGDAYNLLCFIIEVAGNPQRLTFNGGGSTTLLPVGHPWGWNNYFVVAGVSSPPPPGTPATCTRTFAYTTGSLAGGGGTQWNSSARTYSMSDSIVLPPGQYLLYYALVATPQPFLNTDPISAVGNWGIDFTLEPVPSPSPFAWASRVNR
jgi:hypothetical protein